MEDSHEEQVKALSATHQLPDEHVKPAWKEKWYQAMDLRVGIVPLPVYLLLFVLLIWLIYLGKLTAEINMMVAVLAIFGFTCAEVGKRVPLLGSIGGAAIVATFLPSFLASRNLLPTSLVSAVTDFTKHSHFLYLFITAIIVGSILSMDRNVLIKGFFKIFLPLAAGSIAAAIVGTLVGMAFGLSARHTLLFIVVPIMAGGVGEGAIPLSVGYSQLLHGEQGAFFAQVLPPVMFGSLTAILFAGTLNYIGSRYPSLTGEGRLQPGEEDDLSRQKTEVSDHVDVTQIASAALLAITLYIAGVICFETFGLPAPVAMLFLAVFVKLTHLAPPQLQQGAHVVYQFFRSAVTYPLLFAIGVALTPWNELMAALAVPNLVTIVATVATLMATGFVTARWFNLYPIEVAIINACHSGQGGTGDVAILSAANRMQLMPFAQIATRIGGAITVTLTLLFLSNGG